MKIISEIKKEWILLSIVALAFMLRVVGIGYGLPLTVVGDEYPFTYAALQMIQSHQLVPNLQPELFKNILPYPPYLSYTLLPFFTVILGFKYLLFSGALELFKTQTIQDLSVFFMTARIFSVVLGTISVYLVYKITETLFNSRVAAYAAGFLLATSILHEALSIVGRNWMPVSFFFLLALYFLTHPAWTLQKRYVATFAIAGLGMGISSFCGFILAMAGLYYLCTDAKSWRQFLKDIPAIVLGIALFVFLAAVPYLLWHGGNAFAKNITTADVKTISDLLISPLRALSLVVYTEPLIVAAYIFGSLLLFVQHRRLAFFNVMWFLAYIFVFYFVFRFEPRFILPLIPLFAIGGGFLIGQLWNERTRVVICLLLLVPLMGAVRLAYLSLQGDTREYTRAWVLSHLGPGDKVLVFSSGMHIPTQAAAVNELRTLDPGALRQIEDSDMKLNRTDVPYVLNNLTSVTDPDAVSRFTIHSRDRGYDYLVLEPRSLLELHAMAGALAPLISKGTIVQSFEGLGDEMSLYNSAFIRPFPELFSGKLLGPDMVIYRLHD